MIRKTTNVNMPRGRHLYTSRQHNTTFVSKRMPCIKDLNIIYLRHNLSCVVNVLYIIREREKEREREREREGVKDKQ